MSVHCFVCLSIKPLLIEILKYATFEKDNQKFILGIEIDGYRYHSSKEQKYNDLIRQNFIESKGYAIIKILEIRWKK